ncbi:hypothetical protein VNI00_007146 [Paramarasmius palmivorus]|uniref:Xylanolytic transcriptional activator regulatory domain-containing protein n=1 Tax=Paramarasmius palmivorus TaxID=297713 RepID=A0AAW0D5M7_9AGAR
MRLPQCTPCLKSTTHVVDGPCDYEDNRTKVQLLERDVLRLEARLKELEQPQCLGTVKLNKPYTKKEEPDATFKACMIANGPAHLLNVFDPSSNEDVPLELSHFLCVIWSLSQRDADDFTCRVDAFLPHACDFGFFLHMDRFRQSALIPLEDPTARLSRPTRGLLSAIHVLGLRLSGTGPTTPQEEARIAAYLTRAINDVTKMMVTESAHPFVVVQNIQAELLLATFLFCHGRLLEGQYHLTTAISLAIGARLHKIRSSRDKATAGSPFSLAPSDDPVIEGERINAFWMVFTLSNCWDATVDSSTSLIAVFGDGNMEVDVPWPMCMPEYDQGGFPPGLQGTWTVQRFLTQAPPEPSKNECGELAMYAKASVLFKRARKMETHLQRGQEIPDSPTNRVLCALLDSFVATLPALKGRIIHFSHPELAFPYNAIGEECSTIGMQLTTLTLAYSSMIHLYSFNFETDAFSMKKSLEAAKACIEALKNPEVRMYFKRSSRINPGFGCLWETVCGVLLKWMKISRTIAGFKCSDSMLGISEDEVVELLEVIMGVMHSYAWRSPILSEHNLVAFLTHSQVEPGNALEKVRKMYQELPPSSIQP